MPQDEQGINNNDNNNSVTIYEPPSRPCKITMEVPVFLIMFGLCLSGAVITNVLLYRTCIHTLHYPESKCALLLASGPKSNETIQLENEVQQYASIVRMMHSVIEAFFPAILSFFLGVWSDIYGRKPLVVWPLFGTCLSSFLVVAYATLNNFGPWWFLLTAIPFSLSGGYAALFTGAFCYMSDITNNADRSLRMALLETALFVGIIVGSLCSPYALKHLGNVNLLLLTSAVYVLAYVFTNIWVAESINGVANGTLLSVLDFLLVKEMIETCFKRRPNRDRTIIFLLIMCNAFSILVLYGVSNLDYFYVREKLQWSLQTYSVYAAVGTVIMIIGLLFGVTFMQKVLKISDINLALLSYISSIADYAIKAFAVTSWHMYLGTSVSLFRGLASPLIRSILSKILPIEELAKIFSLLSVMDGFFPLLAPLIYNSLYAVTVEVFPGGIYLLCALIYVTTFVMLCFVKYFMWKYSSTPYTALAS